jgi:hypothetical protein
MSAASILMWFPSRFPVPESRFIRSMLKEALGLTEPKIL